MTVRLPLDTEKSMYVRSTTPSCSAHPVVYMVHMYNDTHTWAPKNVNHDTPIQPGPAGERVAARPQHAITDPIDFTPTGPM